MALFPLVVVEPKIEGQTHIQSGVREETCKFPYFK